MSALDVGNRPGDQVFQTSINFVAAANMTVAVGAKPVFTDIVSLVGPTIDPAHVEALMGSQTKAAMVMHYGGYPGEYLRSCG